MQIEWRRIWKVLLGCVCTAAGIALLACGQLGWGLTALEAAVLLLALQYAPRGTRLWKTWWFVELVLALAATVGYAGFAAVRTARRRHPPSSSRRSATRSGHAGAGNRNTGTDHRPGTDVRTRHGGSNLCRQPQGEKIPPAIVPVRRQDQGREPVTFDSTAQAQAAGYAPCGACSIKQNRAPNTRERGFAMRRYMCRSG
ncbi:MAG: hypothetical protein ACLU0Z_00120 [Oscillospiraceae bacterium]